jgi:hypothetical protein
VSNILKSWFLTIFHPIFICDSSSVISSSVTLHLWSLHLWLFICDLFICDLFICDSSSVISSSVTIHLWLFICDLFICAFIFHLWLSTVHWKHKRYQIWKMPYGINNNIFHKLQEKNTLAFSNWTFQIKSLMKSVHAKHFQKLVRCNSYLGPLITSPPLQITVFTLYVIHALSPGTYNYKFYAYYWSLYKIQVLSRHVQSHYLYFSKMLFFCFFFIKPHLYCTYVMHISGSFHYLYQLSFFVPVTS